MSLHHLNPDWNRHLLLQITFISTQPTLFYISSGCSRNKMAELDSYKSSYCLQSIKYILPSFYTKFAYLHFEYVTVRAEAKPNLIILITEKNN